MSGFIEGVAQQGIPYAEKPVLPRKVRAICFFSHPRSGIRVVGGQFSGDTRPRL